MPVIKAEDVAFVRFKAPDLPKMRRFLHDFGLQDAGGDDDLLLMRGSDSQAPIHVTERGPAGFAGFGFRSRSLEDLNLLSAATGRPVQAGAEVGLAGWSVVRLQDPDGVSVDVVAGDWDCAATPAADASRIQWNDAWGTERLNAPKRVETGPAAAKRLGHVVMRVGDLERSWNWYRDLLGVLVSDEVHAPSVGKVALFLRCDRGPDPADHHTLNIGVSPDGRAGFHHAAFEVTDLDALMAGHDHLQRQGYQHSWGVGRHFLGSQVFDYWMDPFGHRVEHWTDGDRFDASTPPHVATLDDMLGVQWGPAVSPSFA